MIRIGGFDYERPKITKQEFLQDYLIDTKYEKIVSDLEARIIPGQPILVVDGLYDSKISRCNKSLNFGIMSSDRTFLQEFDPFYMEGRFTFPTQKHIEKSKGGLWAYNNSPISLTYLDVLYLLDDDLVPDIIIYSGREQIETFLGNEEYQSALNAIAINYEEQNVQSGDKIFLPGFDLRLLVPRKYASNICKSPVRQSTKNSDFDAEIDKIERDLKIL